MNDMATRLPTGSRGRQARAERILDVTAELLLRHGYKRVTIDDVATGAEVGKGTIYLHWKTREALFWAVLQREAARMLEQILADLSEDPRLALPSRLMPAIFVQAARRPLVRAVLLSDSEVLGDLARDAAVAAAQQELAGNENYLELLREQGLLRPGLTAATAGYILGSVMRGFFAEQETAGQGASGRHRADQETGYQETGYQETGYQETGYQETGYQETGNQETAGQGARQGAAGGLPLSQQADLLADVLHRSLETEEEPSRDAVAALAARVRELFTAIVTVQRGQLERAYR